MLTEIIYYILTGVKRWCKQRRPRGQLATIKIFSFESTQRKIEIRYKTVKQFGSFKTSEGIFSFFLSSVSLTSSLRKCSGKVQKLFKMHQVRDPIMKVLNLYGSFLVPPIFLIPQLKERRQSEPARERISITVSRTFQRFLEGSCTPSGFPGCGK